MSAERFEPMVRVPSTERESLGLDWQRRMREGLIDTTVPTYRRVADPVKVLTADKHYMVDPLALRTGGSDLALDGAVHRGEKTVGLRIGDDIPDARAGGHTVNATLVVYCRPLPPGERLSV